MPAEAILMTTWRGSNESKQLNFITVYLEWCALGNCERQTAPEEASGLR